MEETTTPPNNPAQNLSDAEFFGEKPKEYAGFWLRFVAIFIDAIIINIAITPISMMLGVPTPFDMGENSYGLKMELGGRWHAILIQWLYFALMESSAKQATLGKMAVGIIVTGEDGGKLNFARATGRYFSKILSGLILFIGFIMAGFTPKKQALHDIIVRSLVIKKPAELKK